MIAAEIDRKLYADKQPWHQPEKVVLPGGDPLLDFSLCGCPQNIIDAGRDPNIPQVVVYPSKSVESQASSQSDGHSHHHKHGLFSNIKQQIKNVAQPHLDKCLPQQQHSCHQDELHLPDQSHEIQAAIDKASQMPVLGSGFRAVVLLKAGTYGVDSKGFTIKQSGVILRGEVAQDGRPLTRLVCRTKDKGTLFTVMSDTPAGRAYDKTDIVGRLGVGVTRVHVKSTDKYKVGDSVRVVRRCNQKWIEDIGMDDKQMPRRPNDPSSTKPWGPFNLFNLRYVTGVDKEHNYIDIDVGVTTTIEDKYGGGHVEKFDDSYRVSQVAIENFEVVCHVDFSQTQTDNKTKQTCWCDDNHLETTLSMDNCIRSWASNIHSHCFGHGCVLQGGAKFSTIEYCSFNKPAAKIDGGKRYGFTINGSCCLVQHCTTEEARHAYAVSSRIVGPNVFHDCTAVGNMGCSETHQRWASGFLYDNIRGNVAIQNRAWMGSGQGWSGANCIVWNCGPEVIVQHPPTAYNFAIGQKNVMQKGKHSFPSKDKRMDDICYFYSNGPVQPQSLFQYQREQRRLREKKH
ncbi:hypothetical protein MIR68_008954 [Amoeboaphelidium protococcarum]|nr:hypothetical protein MIR68_008954 [Amoeboaphelidium protococcarum]